MKPEFTAAAKWWADQLRGPVRLNNGDAFQSGMAEVMLGSKPRPTADKIAIFERALAEAIERRCSQYWQEDNPEYGAFDREIMIDYHPNTVFLEAAAVAGIKLGMGDLPWKTYMQIDPGNVQVASGYQAQALRIYPNE